MMQPSRPIDGDVDTFIIKFYCPFQRSTGVHGTKIEQTVEHRAVILKVEDKYTQNNYKSV